MTTVGVTLDSSAWCRVRESVMEEVLSARWQRDEVFREIALEARRQRVELVHFERSSAKSFWGGAVRPGAVVVGRNRLGRTIARLADGELADAGRALRCVLELLIAVRDDKAASPCRERAAHLALRAERALGKASAIGVGAVIG